MSSEVVPIHPELAPTAPITPQAMLSTAVARGDTALAEKLMDLHERWEARNARKAFDTAIAAAKAEIPVIYKNREMNAGSGRTTYRYEDMAAIATAINPVLSKHGLGYRFRTKAEPDLVTVTCVVFHADGHSEENTLCGRPDTSGSKNAIQSLGSAVTYLQRYALKAALGLAASADDDGTGNGSPAGGNLNTISEEQVVKLAELIKETKSNLDLFCQYFRIETLGALPTKDFDRAVAALEKKRKP